MSVPSLFRRIDDALEPMIGYCAIAHLPSSERKKKWLADAVTGRATLTKILERFEGDAQGQKHLDEIEERLYAAEGDRRLIKCLRELLALPFPPTADMRDLCAKRCLDFKKLCVLAHYAIQEEITKPDADVASLERLLE